LKMAKDIWSKCEKLNWLSEFYTHHPINQGLPSDG